MAKEKGGDNMSPEVNGLSETVTMSKADLQNLLSEFAKQFGVKRSVGDPDKRRVAAIPYQRFVITDESGKELARVASMTEVIDYCTDELSSGTYTVDTVLEVVIK